MLFLFSTILNKPFHITDVYIYSEFMKTAPLKNVHIEYTYLHIESVVIWMIQNYLCFVIVDYDSC